MLLSWDWEGGEVSEGHVESEEWVRKQHKWWCFKVIDAVVAVRGAHSPVREVWVWRGDAWLPLWLPRAETSPIKARLCWHSL